MTFVRNLSVRGKLLGGFGIVVALLCACVVVALMSMSTMNAGTKNVGLNSLPSVHLIDTVQSDELAYRLAQDDSTLSTTAAQNALYASQITAVAARLTKELAAYAPMVSDATDHGLYQSAQADWQHYLSATGQFLSLSTKNLNQRARAVLTGPAGTAFTSAQSHLGQWQAYNQTLASRSVTSAGSAYSSAKMLLLIVAAIALLVATGIALGLSQMIRATVAQVLDRIRSLQDRCATNLKAGIEALAAGDLTLESTR